MATLAYVSLYRKYRPQSFADVVGQKHVTQTVINAIEEDRLHHAYLFTGPRGTGKTSTARILAKSINCETGPTATPCNTCDMCVSITTGASVDVIELDMASHGGVDDARELRDRALFAPVKARKKVYILDEVHMASTAAFNALLKLIEEPPGHVIFAMATTDPQKVIPTIMSRVQRLDLRRIGAGELVAHVRRICELEGYTIDDEAAAAVVRAGDGSARDTLSVLEQVLSYSGHEVTADKVAQVLGQTPVERTFQTVDLVAARDLAGLLGLVQGLLDDGHDLRRFTVDLLQHLRDLLVLQVAPDRPDLVDATEDRRERLAAQRDALPRESMLRAVAVLADTIAEMRQGPARLPLELALARLAVPSLAGDVDGLADRVARLEARPAGAAAPVRTETPPAPTPEAAPTPLQEPPVPAPTATEGGPDGGTEDEREDTPAAEPEPAPAPSRRPGGAPERAPDPGPTGPTRPAAPPSPATAPTPAGTPETSPSPAEQLPPSPVEDLAASDAAAVAADSPGDADAPGVSRAEQLAERARSHAGAAAGADEPPSDEVAAPTPAAGATPAGEGEADLARIRERWDAILDLVKDASRRFHAVYEPAEPVDLRRGVLTLRYAPRYASFHAQNAKKGDHAAALAAAVERSCGVRVKVDTVVEGEAKRPPMPPVVTDTTPLAEEPAEPSEEEAADVREAEHAGGPPSPAEGSVDEMLATELGAELIEERPAPDA